MSSYMKFIIGASSVMFLMLGWHFGTVLRFWGNAPETQFEFFVRLGVIIVGFIIISAVSAVLISAKNESAVEPDERELIIIRKAERNGGHIASVGLLSLMWFAFQPLTPMGIANVALSILCLAEFVKIASGLFYLHIGDDRVVS